MSALHATTILAQRTILVPTDDPTIQSAIDAAQNGDTVLVAPGTYNENLNFEGKAITVTSGAKTYSDAATTIINSATDGPVVVFATNEPATAVLNGFTVQNGHASLASGLNGGGVSISNASPTITNDIVTNNTGCGIFVYSNASPLIQGNDIKGNHGPGAAGGSSCMITHPGAGSPAGAGVGIVYGGNVQVIGNTIENNILDANTGAGANCGAGVEILGGSQILLRNNIIRNNHAQCNAAFHEVIMTPAGSLLLIQNLIYDNFNDVGGTEDPIQVFVSGTLSSPYPSLMEINNTIYGLGEELVWTFGASIMANNVIMNDSVNSAYDQYGLWCADPPAQNSPLNLTNNDIFGTGALQPSGCPLDSSNLSANPDFVDPTNGNFREHSSSPTVTTGDSGTPLIPPTDLDNKNRMVCGTIDMGAYEFHPHPPIALSSSNNPALGGSSVTFTAQLTGNCNVPTGTVTFLDGGAAIGTETLDNSGTARMTTSFLVVGQHNITVSYPGDFNFGRSTSNVLIQTITGDPTSTTLTVSPNPATAFSPITLSSVVTSPHGTPNGTVVFTAGTETLTTATLDANGHTLATISTLGRGSYSIAANYQATTLFHASSSAPFQETVLGANTATTLTASPSPATITQAVTLTAVVRDTQGSTVPVGNVAFMDGTATLGTAALNASGIATFTASTLGAGTQVITASYAGTANFNPSSATVSETVALIGTSLVLAAFPNPANNGQTVTLTATATSMPAGMAPAGTVTFHDGSSVLGAASLDLSGTATFSISSLAVGTHPLTAVLTTGADFSGSTSTVVNEVIQAYDFTISLSKDSLSLPSGDWTLMSVTVTPIGGFAGSVLLSCSRVPDHTQCVFSNGSQVSLASGAKTVQLTINTSDVYGFGQPVSRSTPFGSNKNGGPLAAALLVPALGLLGLSGRKLTMLRFLLIVWITIGLLAAMLCIQSCSGKLPAKTAPGTYSIIVTGTSTDQASLTHTALLELVVTPAPAP
jgi:parallel beta-helix repeat protein